MHAPRAVDRDVRARACALLVGYEFFPGSPPAIRAPAARSPMRSLAAYVKRPASTCSTSRRSTDRRQRPQRKKQHLDAMPDDRRQPMGDRRRRRRHDAILRELGSLQDFQRLLRKAAAQGSRSRSTSRSVPPTPMGAAEHPEWFAARRRLDPVRRESEEVSRHLPVDFESMQWRNVAGPGRGDRVWVGQGVRILE